MSKLLAVKLKALLDDHENPLLLRTLLGLAGGLLFFLAYPLVHAWWPAEPPAILVWVASEVSGIHLVVTEKDIDAAILSSARWQWCVAGFLFGFGSEWLWFFLNDRVFPRPDTEVLTPLPLLLPYDPLWGSGLNSEIDSSERAMPWIPPTSGDRLATWRQLWHFAKSKGSDGRFTIFGRPKSDFDDFRWTVLAGRSGSGKTRMAVEFLDRQLARANHLKAPGRLRWWERQKILLGAWWRRVCPGVSPRGGDFEAGSFGDPWDIGWVRQVFPNQVRRHSGRKYDRDYLKRLSKWQPRRPTAFLLDDPLLNEAGAVIEAFRNGASRYRFPVRLLIVNQTLPNELNIKADKDFYGEILFLTEQSGFSAEEIRHIPYSLLNTRPESVLAFVELEKQIEALTRISEGNPLLVELGLRLALAGKDLQRIKAADLIEHRAERIMESLEQAHPSLGPEEYRLIASATLAGPSLAALGNDQSLSPAKGAFLKHLGDKMQNLNRCFNLAHPRSGRQPKEQVFHLPAVRPERVGDAFVQLVLQEKCHGLAGIEDEVASLGWQLNARGVLRVLARTAARSGQLGRVMRNAPPADLNSPIEPIEIAIALCRAAAHVQPYVNPPEDGGWAVVQVACCRIAGLEPRAARTLALTVSRDLFEDHEIKQIRPGAAGVCYLNAVARLSDGEGAPEDIEVAIRVMRQSHLFLSFIRRETSWLHSVEVKLARAGAENLASRMLRFAQPRNEEFDRMLAILLCELSIAKSLHGDLTGAVAALLEVDRIATNRTGDIEIVKARALGWAGICVGGSDIPDPAGCQHVAQIVDDIAASLATEGDTKHLLETTRGISWRAVCMARAKAKDLEGAEEAAQTVDRIAEPFNKLLPFEYERALAWSYLASKAGDLDDLDRCRLATRQVKEICGCFAGSDFFYRCAVASTSLSLACLKRAFRRCPPEKQAINLLLIAECEESVNDVESIARLFPGSEQFGYLHAQALRNLCHLHGEAIDSRRRQAVAAIDNITEWWPKSLEIAEYAADAFANDSLYSEEEVHRTEEAAVRIGKLLKRFPSAEKIQRSCVIAQIALHRSRALSSSHIPDVPACLEELRNLEALTRSGQISIEDQDEALTGWVWLAHAYYHVPDALKCEETAISLAELVSELGVNSERARLQARTWMQLAKTAAKTRDLERLGRAIERMEKLESQWPKEVFHDSAAMADIFDGLRLQATGGDNATSASLSN